MSAFGDWWNGLLADLMTIGHNVWDFAKPRLIATATQLGKDGIAIVMAQVKQVEVDYLNGDKAMAKKDMAFNRIKPALIEAGIKDVKDNIINGAIEDAVANLTTAQ